LFWGNAFVTIYDMDQRFLLLPLACMFLILPVELYRKRENPFTNIAHGFLGIIYVAVPFTLMVNVIHLDSIEGYRPEFLVGFFMLIWASDTGAYFAGSLFGKRKLFERISPKKSWEGAAGGMALSLVMAAIWAQFIDIIDLRQWLILAGISVVAGIYGDLVESLLKRNTGVKDSGSILPGHGGVLDRFDSIILATPFAFVYLKSQAIDLYRLVDLQIRQLTNRPKPPPKRAVNPSLKLPRPQPHRAVRLQNQNHGGIAPNFGEGAELSLVGVCLAPQFTMPWKARLRLLVST
jgi:CDP-diglyceride synthetase